MKKTIFLVFLIIVIVAGISVFPVAAFAECSNEITEGDICTLSYLSGYKLKDNFIVEISYQNYTLYSSGIYRAFVITFDNEYCQNIEESDTGYNCSSFMSALELLFSSRGYELNKDIENARFTAAAKYESITDMYIQMGIDGYETNEKSSASKNGFFYKEHQSSIKTVFSNIETSGNLINGMLQLLYQIDIDNDDILLNYTYGTPYKIISTDADETKYIAAQKIYTHSYDMTMSNYDREITMTQKTPNATGWYIVAVGIALIVLILPLLIAIIRKKDGKNG